MLRAFTDSTGVEWRVWDILPISGPLEAGADVLSGSLKNTAFANGWLCFESDNEKRRLAPIPLGWESSESSMLDHWRQQAAPVTTRDQRRRQAATEASGASATA
jgi:hypothetical protein